MSALTKIWLILKLMQGVIRLIDKLFGNGDFKRNAEVPSIEVKEPEKEVP